MVIAAVSAESWPLGIVRSSRVLWAGPSRLGSRMEHALMAVLRVLASAVILAILSGNLYAYPVRYDFSGRVEGVAVSPEEGERPFEGPLTGAVIFEGGPAVVRVPPKHEDEWPHFRVRLSQTIALDGRTWTSANDTVQFCDVYLAMQHQEVQFECGLDLGGGWRLRSMLWLPVPLLLPDDLRIPEGPFVGGSDGSSGPVFLDIENGLAGEMILARGHARIDQISSVDEPASAWLLLPFLAGWLLHRRRHVRGGSTSSPARSFVNPKHCIRRRLGHPRRRGRISGAGAEALTLRRRTMGITLRVRGVLLPISPPPDTPSA